ncbi:hypothetical protein P7L78_03565 (plasmid) [Tistrella bauzanensis]|uniref:Uncharacterized protein n=1 Tax=Tistrella arctica TaxID=3133430 RepID=A0ABU9YNF0_9PROT
MEAAGPTWGDAGDPDSFAGFIARVMDDPQSYARSSPADRAEVFRRMNLLMTMAQTEWQGRLRDNPGLVPKPPTKLRVTPEY